MYEDTIRDYGIMCQRIINGVLTLCALVEAMSNAKHMTSIL